MVGPCSGSVLAELGLGSGEDEGQRLSRVVWGHCQVGRRLAEEEIRGGGEDGGWGPIETLRGGEGGGVERGGEADFLAEGEGGGEMGAGDEGAGGDPGSAAGPAADVRRVEEILADAGDPLGEDEGAGGRLGREEGPAGAEDVFDRAEDAGSEVLGGEEGAGSRSRPGLLDQLCLIIKVAWTGQL